jgi:leucine dehydrogenase
VAEIDADWGVERVIAVHDKATGLRAVIVIDSSDLGPALGGIRLQRYESQAAAVTECRRLARAMTLKNTLAETGYGGGKTVVAWTDDIESRDGALRALGKIVAELGGLYIPASDIGTSADDLAVVGHGGADVAGGDTDTSLSTATGVHAALRAAARHVGLPQNLGGVSVCIQGAGKVGSRLARLLVADGALVRVSDLDSDRVARLAAETGAQVVEPTQVIEADCDVLAPCATGGMISPRDVARLGCRIVAGAANNVLTHPEVARALSARRIVFVPDFVASAGGVIQVQALRGGWDTTRLDARLQAIGDTVARILADAESSDQSTVDIAETMAAARLAGAAKRSTHLPPPTHSHPVTS